MNNHSVPTVTLTGVSKVYAEGRSEEVRALRGIDLTIPPGEFVSVEGPSGCGKTTLLNLIGLLDVPTKGSLLWDGQPVAERTERERSRLRLTGVGFIFQRFYLLPTLNARENVELPMRALGVPVTERKRRALELLDSVGVGERGGAYPHQLSGGEEQRVAIARALANRPGLLPADEPTGELDSRNAEGILRLVRRAHEEAGVSLVIVTHNPVVASQAQRHLRMQDGHIVADVRGP